VRTQLKRLAWRPFRKKEAGEDARAPMSSFTLEKRWKAHDAGIHTICPEKYPVDAALAKYPPYTRRFSPSFPYP
jgi:hypothetical protein